MTINTIFYNNEFFKYPQLENLLAAAQENRDAHIVINKNTLKEYVPDDCFCLVLDWIVCKIKALWHNIWLSCSQSYSDSFQAAVTLINKANKEYKIQELTTSLEADREALNSTKTLKDQQQEIFEGMQEEREREKKQYITLEIKLKFLDAEAAWLAAKIEDPSVPAASTSSSSSSFLSSFLSSTNPHSIEFLKEKQTNVEKDIKTTRHLIANLKDFTEQLDRLNKEYSTLEGKIAASETKLRILRGEAPLVEETKCAKLTRLITEVTGEKLAGLFSALFNNFEDAEDNIAKDPEFDEGTSTLTVELHHPWRIYSPSESTKDGVIIKIHQILKLKLFENGIEFTSDDSTGLQTLLRKGWQMKANINKITLLATDMIKMEVTVPYAWAPPVENPYDEMYRLWNTRCVPIPDTFKQPNSNDEPYPEHLHLIDPLTNTSYLAQYTAEHERVKNL